MLGEFDLINKFFKFATSSRSDVLLGIGDDCALLNIPDGQQLAITTDTLVSGTHFPENLDAASIGYKALSVNLSDLAAMGAEPACVTLCLTVPKIDTDWLSKFMQGFLELAKQYGVQLIGGDTTEGPLSISVQAYGFIPEGKALKRSRARVGDTVFVSGTLGDAGLALKENKEIKFSKSSLHFLMSRLNRPSPRIELGIALRFFNASAIDISDGLCKDLNHICEESKKGMTIHLQLIPLSSELKKYIRETGDWTLPLSAGDDYELAFTISPDLKDKFLRQTKELSIPVTEIGIVNEGKRVNVIDTDGLSLEIMDGYEHFKKK
tara:strand:+ start:5837 stop:6802 length:966 start_codon:yes stop_codon:yes gene_type:complete